MKKINTITRMKTNEPRSNTVYESFKLKHKSVSLLNNDPFLPSNKEDDLTHYSSATMQNGCIDTKKTDDVEGKNGVIVVLEACTYSECP